MLKKKKNRRFTQREGCGTAVVIYYRNCFVLSLLGLFLLPLGFFFLSFLLLVPSILLDGLGFS